LSTRPAKSIGTDQDWEIATSALEDSLKGLGLSYEINEGDGAFYGPKIDIKLKDALRRSWQCATIQCDFNLPRRFSLEYIDADGSAKQPIMLHRVLLGSIERFIACLTEHYAGAFPLWLAPLQAVVIPVRENFNSYSAEVVNTLLQAGIRAETYSSNETLNKRIRQAEINKVPYILVVGERELASNQVSVRKRHDIDKGLMGLDAFISQLGCEITNRLH